MGEITGRVIQGLGGLYSVRYIQDGAVCEAKCRARGNIRRTDDKVYVGDAVTLTLDGENSVIESVLPRKNSLIRPPLSNLDYIFITFSPANPAPALMTIDKLTAIATHNSIEPIIIITKSDSSDTLPYENIYQSAGFECFVCSSVTSDGIERIRECVTSRLTDGRIGAFAGASGVGKSTLMNAIFPSLSIQTGDISHKIQRGKHTTRHVELYPIDDGLDTGFLADTPGFSMLDFEHFDFFTLEDLLPAFPDILSYTSTCRYADCTHTKEQECGVVSAVKDGAVSRSRHESYLELYRILKEKSRKYSGKK